MRKLAIVLGITTGLGLANFALARQSTSALQASFDRDSQRQATAATPIVRATPTPLQTLFAKALRAQADPVRLAFRRDLDRLPAPVYYASPTNNERDPLAEAIHTALWGNSNPVLASFSRDLYHAPTPPAATLIDRADSVQTLFNKILQLQHAKTSILAAHSEISPLETAESVTN